MQQKAAVEITFISIPMGPVSLAKNISRTGTRMERIAAAMGVYWPEVQFSVTSPLVTIPEYLARAREQGVSENASVSVIVGDFQRMDLYARKGYQLPQHIPEEAWKAFRDLVNMGYDKQLAKE